MKKGYTEVYDFVGGIPEWRKFNYPMTVNAEWQKQKVSKIPPQKLQKLMAENDFYILDVCPRDFIEKASFIEGSFFCPLVHLDKWHTKIPRDRPIIVTDWNMRQSVIAAKFLSNKGYQIYGVLKGGIKRWKSDNLPVADWGSIIDPKSWYIPQE